MQRFGIRALLIVLSLAVATPLYAYQVALKGGRIIQFQKYRAAADQLYYVAGDGKEVAVPLATIDLERTRQLNTGEFPPLELPGLVASARLESGQAETSVGDYARKLREKQSKDGKDHSWATDALRNSPNTLSTGTYVPPIPQAGKPFDYKAEAKKTDDLADYLEGRTRRQLADDIVRDIQFPGRPNWESRLDSKRQKLVAALRSAAAAYRKADSTPGIGTAAMQEATWKLSLENVGWRELVEEGVREADKWGRSRQ